MAACVLHSITLLSGEPFTYGELKEERSSPKRVLKDFSGVEASLF